VSGLVEAVRFQSLVQAELARAYLESCGLHAVVFDALNQGYSDGALIGVRLMVLDEELEEALAALGDYGA
jgi:Putative prokaryotic signal transducing protein